MASILSRPQCVKELDMCGETTSLSAIILVIHITSNGRHAVAQTVDVLMVCCLKQHVCSGWPKTYEGVILIVLCERWICTPITMTAFPCHHIISTKLIYNCIAYFYVTKVGYRHIEFVVLYQCVFMSPVWRSRVCCCKFKFNSDNVRYHTTRTISCKASNAVLEDPSWETSLEMGNCRTKRTLFQEAVIRGSNKTVYLLQTINCSSICTESLVTPCGDTLINILHKPRMTDNINRVFGIHFELRNLLKLFNLLRYLDIPVMIKIINLYPDLIG